MEKDTLAKYAHLKQDILGDGIKEGKLTAFENLSNEINSSNNGGSGGNTDYPYYGLFYGPDELYFFELNNINDPLNELQALDNGETPEFKKIIFEGVYNDSTNGFENDTTGKSIVNPSMVLDFSGDLVEFFNTGKENSSDLLSFLEIDKGVIFSLQYGSDPYSIIVSKHLLDNAVTDGYYAILC